MSIPRMRTARGILDVIRAEDPETGISEHHIRRLMKSGAVPIAHSGRKCLANADEVIRILSGGSRTNKNGEQPNA